MAPRISPTKINGMTKSVTSQAGSRRRIRSSLPAMARLRRIVVLFLPEMASGQIQEHTLQARAEDVDAVQSMDVGIELVEDLRGCRCWVRGGEVQTIPVVANAESVDLHRRCRALEAKLELARPVRGNQLGDRPLGDEATLVDENHGRVERLDLGEVMR